MSTAVDSDDVPVDPDDELLVAYLDGELDDSERLQVERRLLDEDTLRERMRRLQAGWDLLDDLVVPDASPKLVETTLQMAVAAVEGRTGFSAGRILPSRWPIVVVALCLASVLTTLAVAEVVKLRRRNQQLRDLAIIESLDAYRAGRDLDLMQQLADNEDWVQAVSVLMEVSDNAGRSEAASMLLIASTPLEQREALIENLSDEKRTELAWRSRDFANFREQTRESIRAIADAVHQQQDPQRVLKTMHAYARWRETIHPVELREQIESSDLDTRKAAIETAIRQTQAESARRSMRMLDDETIDLIYYALRWVVQKRIERGDSATVTALEQISQRFPEARDPQSILLRRMVGDETRSRRRGGLRPGPLTSGELELVRLALTESALETLEMITSGIPLYEDITIRIWSLEAVQRKSERLRRQRTPQQRYQMLSPAQRELIDMLPPQEIYRRLTR